jgi:hypothetical protein
MTSTSLRRKKRTKVPWSEMLSGGGLVWEISLSQLGSRHGGRLPPSNGEKEDPLKSSHEDMKVRVSPRESCVPGQGHRRCETPEASSVSIAAD